MHVEGGSAVAVRRATMADVAAVQTVGLLVWPETYLPFTSPDFVLDGLATWWSRAAVERSIIASTTFVAEDHGRVIGTATTGRLEGEPVLWKLYILPDHRGRGAGRALLDAVLAVAADRPLLVEVTAGNEQALRFYGSAGFRHERDEPGPHGTRTTWMRCAPGLPAADPAARADPSAAGGPRSGVRR